MPIEQYVSFIIAMAVLGTCVVAGLLIKIRSIRVTNDKAASIAHAIREGAMEFLSQEYRIILMVVAIVAGFLAYFMSPVAAAIFVAGSLISMLAGFIGMCAATDANVRTTMAAKDHGEHAAFLVAFFGGGVMGFAVASFGLFGLGALLYFYYGDPNFIDYITSFGFGAVLLLFLHVLAVVFIPNLLMLVQI